MSFWSLTSWAQPTAIPETANSPTKKSDPLQPQQLKLPTKDQLEIGATYYPGTRGKKTVPVLLIHGWDGRGGPGSSSDLVPLARALQRDGHAVILPDLRGHGRSVMRTSVDAPPQRIDRDRFRAADLRDMLLDVEAARSYLLRENNAGRLNIELLTVVGFEVGALIGMHWVDYDWSTPPLPTYKQGQDAKAFVLISPPASFRGLTMQSALSNEAVRSNLSALVIYGKELPTAVADGKRIHNLLHRAHRLPTNASKTDPTVQDLFLVELGTSLQGSHLVGQDGLDLERTLNEFILRRLVARENQFPWNDRTRPQ